MQAAVTVSSSTVQQRQNIEIDRPDAASVNAAELFSRNNSLFGILLQTFKLVSSVTKIIIIKRIQTENTNKL